jgi:light-regulated signal transduction histidine kinase (bacteriophytochrome)
MEELEDQVQLRTQDLNNANEMLRENNSKIENQNRDLEILSRENRSLLNIVVHDISNPLQILLYFFSKIPQEEMPEPYRKSYERSTRAASTIKDILRNARKLHSIKIGKEGIELKEISVRNVIEEVILSLRRRH